MARDIMQSANPGTMLDRMVDRIAKTIMIRFNPKNIVSGLVD